MLHCRRSHCTMSLQVSKSKPRQLRYCAGGLRTDLTLVEVDDKLLVSISNDQVTIKGDENGDAVLCTSSNTYELKLVETTNTLLLLPPQPDLDDDFAAIRSLTPGPSDAAGARDIGLQTQLQKNVVSKDYPALMAAATATAHIELVEIAPRLDLLPSLLGERPYSLEDEEDQETAAAADDDTICMDAEGPGASSRTAGKASSKSRGCYTTEQLLTMVQASSTELLAELKRLNAIQLNGVWRLVDEAYLGSLLELVIVSAVQHGWDVDAIPLHEAIAAVQEDGYLPAITQHCLEVYGSVCDCSSSGRHYSLDEKRVCLHYARRLLAESRTWYKGTFMQAWREAVPECYTPRADMLLGEALIMQPLAAEGAVEPRVRHFPARQLPSAPKSRFATLFAAQPRWTRDELDPYLEGLQVPGQTVDMLLLKYARASQRSPTDPTIEFVAR